jgi:chemotaxis protein CheX
MTLISSTLRDDIDDVTRQVWTNILDLPVEAVRAESSPVMTSSSVQILGGWTGALVLSMTEELATTIASTMFSLDSSELSEVDVIDAVGEMANMIGGNVKSLLPGPSQLSMPTVTAGEQEPAFPATEVVERLEFTACGQPFNVTLVQKDDEGEPTDQAEGNDR